MAPRRTLMMTSAENGDMAEVKKYISEWKDINALNGLGSCTALHLAAEEGHTVVVKALIKAGADTDARDRLQKTALHDAARNGHLEVVETLIKAGSDPSVKSTDGSTPMHYAAMKGHYEVSRALLEAGADPSVRNEENHTPLYLAECSNHENVVKLLLGALAVKYAKPKSSRTCNVLGAGDVGEWCGALFCAKTSK